MNFFIALVCVCSQVSINVVNGGYYHNPWSKMPMKMIFDNTWTSTGTVPDFLPEPPAEPLYMKVKGKMVYPNTPLKTSELQDFPQLWWKTEPGALYTVLIEDNEPELPVKIAHFLAINVPGTSILSGDIVVDYWPSTTFDKLGEDGFDPDLKKKKRHLVLVYKQKERISIPPEKGNVGCFAEPGFFNRAALPHGDLQEQYDLEGPVAGTFYTVTYEEGWSQYYFCYAGSCAGTAIPYLIEGLTNFEAGNPSSCKKPEVITSRWWSSARWSSV